MSVAESAGATRCPGLLQQQRQAVLLCAPSTVTSAGYACPLPPGRDVTFPTAVPPLERFLTSRAPARWQPSTTSPTRSPPSCPGTTVITASIAGSGSAAGYFSTCPPKSISITLNGSTTGNRHPGCARKTWSPTSSTPLETRLPALPSTTSPPTRLNITAGPTGAVTASFPGTASVYAICQPGACNPAPD